MAAEMRKDMVRDRWVVIATDQAMKPSDFPISKSGGMGIIQQSQCPFCEGHESDTPGEVAAFRSPDSEADGPGWTIRVVPNKFSPFILQGDLNLNRQGIYRSCNLLGRHEVVVETPVHGTEFHDFSCSHIEQIYAMIKQRYNELSHDTRIKYIQIYKNRGLFAGASLAHSHSQILAYPGVPDEQNGIKRYFQEQGRCLICSILEQEQAAGVRIVGESEAFVIVCPYASRFPYESWIIPRRHCPHFGDITPEEIKDLSLLLKSLLLSVLEGLHDPSYNIIVNTSPVNVMVANAYHWYIEVIPRLIINAGVEFTTGCYMNPVSPEISTSVLSAHLMSLHQRRENIEK